MPATHRIARPSLCCIARNAPHAARSLRAGQWRGFHAGQSDDDAAPRARAFVCLCVRVPSARCSKAARRGVRRNRRAGRDARADPLVLPAHAAAAQRVLRRGLRLFHLQLRAAARVGHDGAYGRHARAGTRPHARAAGTRRTSAQASDIGKNDIFVLSMEVVAFYAAFQKELGKRGCPLASRMGRRKSRRRCGAVL